MNTCANSGYLVSGTRALPLDPTDFHIDGLAIVGCSRIRCGRCKSIVRNAPGFAFRTADDVSGSDLTKLYELHDPASSPLLHNGRPEWRLYYCRCSRWLENDQHACAEPDLDRDRDPTMPWACDGHPLIELPHDIDGVLVSTQTELRDLILRGLHGETPSYVREEDIKRGYWMARLPARLAAPENKQVVIDATVECLTDPDAHVRALALELLTVSRSPIAEMRLVEVLDHHRDLFAGVPNEISRFDVDATLEGTAWRVLGPAVASDTNVRERARRVALGGHGNRAVYDALCASDSEWIVEHIDDIVRVAPSSAEELMYSFEDLPRSYKIGPLRDRVRQLMK